MAPGYPILNLQVAERIAALLAERHVPVVLIGAVALAAHRYVRFLERELNRRKRRIQRSKFTPHGSNCRTRSSSACCGIAGKHGDARLEQEQTEETEREIKISVKTISSPERGTVWIQNGQWIANQ